MKTRKTICILLAIAAILCGAAGIVRTNRAQDADAAYAESNLTKAESMLALANQLGKAQTVYTTAGQPIRSEYDDPIFTAGLYASVDAYREENRLYQGIAQLAALPELRDLQNAGASYAVICETAKTVYTEQLAEVNASYQGRHTLDIVLIAAGVLGLIGSLVYLQEPQSTANPVATRKHPDRPGQKQHTIVLHHI